MVAVAVSVLWLIVVYRIVYLRNINSYFVNKPISVYLVRLINFDLTNISSLDPNRKCPTTAMTSSCRLEASPSGSPETTNAPQSVSKMATSKFSLKNRTQREKLSSELHFLSRISPEKVKTFNEFYSFSLSV